MTTETAETRIRRLIHYLCREQGDERRHFVIKPRDGGWDNALSYEVTRRDGKRAYLWRANLEDDNIDAMRASLNNFV